MTLKTKKVLTYVLVGPIWVGRLSFLAVGLWGLLGQGWGPFLVILGVVVVLELIVGSL